MEAHVVRHGRLGALLLAGCAGAAPAPPTALHLDGAPAADPRIAAALRPFLDAKSADLLDFDGARLLIATRAGATKQLFAVTAGDVTQLTSAQEPIARGRWVPGDDDGFVLSADDGGDEQDQLWRVDGDHRVRLTDGASRNVSPVWSPDGEMLAWASTARDGKDLDIWLGDGATAASAELAIQVSGAWAPIEFSDDGNELLLGEVVSGTRSHLYRLDLTDAALTRITEDDDVSNPTARYGPDGRLYVLSDRPVDGQRRLTRLWEVGADGGWHVRTGALDAEVELVEVAPSGRFVAFVVDVDGASELRLLDVATGAQAAAAGAPTGGVIGALQFADDDRLALSWSSADTPGEVDVYDRDAATLTAWTHGDRAGLDPAALIAPSPARAPSFDGFEVPLWITRPAARGRSPVVVELHGGPEQQWRPRFQPFEQFLASRGYAVVQPNVRGSTGDGRDVMMLDDQGRRAGAVADVGAVLDWIATQPDLDASRVAVMGQSYGGYLALASVVAHGARLRAGIDVVGISSFATFLAHTSAYRQDLRRAEYGDERDPAMRAVLDELSPLTHAAAITTPLLVAQGANDPRVPASEAAQIVDAVRAAGVDVWYLLADNEGHGFARQENKEVLQVLSTMFLDRYLR